MNASLVCKVMGVVFIIVAIWGFVDGAKVWIFQVNTAHNAVHLLSGIGALVCGFAGQRASGLFSLIFGAVYGLVAVLGFMGVGAAVEFLNLNHSDHVLHVALAAVFLVTGFVWLATSKSGTSLHNRV